MHRKIATKSCEKWKESTFLNLREKIYLYREIVNEKWSPDSFETERKP